MKLVKMAPSQAVDEVMARLDRLEGMLRTGKAATPRPEPRVEPGPPARPRPEDSPVSSNASSETPAPEAQAPEVPGAPVQAEAEPSRGDGLTLEAVREKWPDFVVHVKSEKVSLGTFLAEGRPATLSDRRLETGLQGGRLVPRGTGPAQRGVPGGGNGRILRRFTFASVVTSTGADDGGAAQEHGTATDERVQMALEIFDGEVVSR